MTKRIRRHSGTPMNIPQVVVRVAIGLSFFAILLIILIAITAVTANTMMSLDKKPLPNIPSNILPKYSPTSFVSFDEQTHLSGWFFKTDNPKSTVILVHDSSSNRMPFDVDTVDLIEDILNAQYNVFLFDQRNSGESDGSISGYGYLEWKDVIGAIEHVRKISVTTNVILYGVGAGCSSVLLALEKLPESGEYSNTHDQNMDELDFDRSYIIGVILDSPAKNSDDYIQPKVKEASNFSFITQYTVPYAIRISAGESTSVNLSAEISHLQIPVCIIYGDQDSFIGASKIEQIVAERERLHPSTTAAYIFPGAGYVGAYASDPIKYRQDIVEFLLDHFQ